MSFIPISLVVFKPFLQCNVYVHFADHIPGVYTVLHHQGNQKYVQAEEVLHQTVLELGGDLYHCTLHQLCGCLLLQVHSVTVQFISSVDTLYTNSHSNFIHKTFLLNIYVYSDFYAVCIIFIVSTFKVFDQMSKSFGYI